MRTSGRIYERLVALAARRRPRRLYHSALVATTEDGRVMIEMAPQPDDRGRSDRGVVAEGAVGSRWLRPIRVFRYEVRCWPNGVIPDLAYAVASPVRVTDDPEQVRRSSASFRSCRHPCGDGTNCASARCGTRTPWCRGSCPKPASSIPLANLRSKVVRPAGTQALRPPEGHRRPGARSDRLRKPPEWSASTPSASTRSRQGGGDLRPYRPTRRGGLLQLKARRRHACPGWYRRVRRRSGGAAVGAQPGGCRKRRAHCLNGAD